ncbi:hypothetical protein HALLA_01145 (plasmid) [Halostagnicola larsenii XH-48]|uniref:ATPase domain-containing protein n=1 Tax=Halostagnicola larsenii XH-48 TaxID=797299 RepID=W0JXB3_9EURY|nr:hypothetical protein HALLA_01145 [Halostagnicola larsenii XH-48]
MEHFVDREDELSRLRSCYESDGAKMIVIFGRRRLRKTQLVQHSLSDREDAVVYQATETTSQIQLNEFVDVASETFPRITQIKQNWEALLGYLGDQNGIVVLDEFPYLINADRSLPSVIQRLWDQRFQNTSGTLILVGSSISMMEEATLLGNSPLYERFTERLDLRPLDFAAAQEFVSDDYSPQERIITLGIFGGVPSYLDGVELNQVLGTVLTEEVLSQKDISTTNQSTCSGPNSRTRTDTLRSSPQLPRERRHRTKSPKQWISMENRFQRIPRN